MADSASNKVLRFLISRDIVKGKSREELLAKLDGAGFSAEHAEQFIAQAERKVLARNRRGALAVYDADHGDGRSAEQGGALAWLEELLARENITDVDGEIWLHCYPRVLGYSFKPVSFWYCQRKDASLRAIVAEVNNTFGERHTYVLDHPVYGQEMAVDKVFHVSPFCPVEGSYRFQFQRSGAHGLQTTRLRIDYHDQQGALLLTGMGGRLQPLTAASRRHALWRYPLLTLAVITRIHWHALLLWIKRAPFHSKPPPPAQAVTRSSSPPH